MLGELTEQRLSFKYLNLRNSRQTSLLHRLSSSTCCSLYNPPYFVKQLPTPTTDDIEARICLYAAKQYENIAVDLIELYVQ